MSALGDYIHLRASNYALHGTTYKGAYDSIASYQDYIKKRAAAIQDINESTIATLKQRLQNDSGNQEKIDEAQSNANFQEKIDKIYEILAERVSQGTLGRFEGSSAWKYSGDYDALKGKSLSEGEIEHKRMLVGMIHNLLDKIQEDGAQGQASQADINQLVHFYNELSGQSLAKNKSALGIIQEDIDNYHYYTWISNVAGEFGEMLVAACQDTAEATAFDEVNNLLAGVVGSQTSEITLQKAELARDLSQYGMKTDSTGSYYKFGKTQNKVDVDIMVNSENVFASVKNYYDPKSVTLQSQTSLLAALVKMNQEGNYANHWLNAHAGRISKTADAAAANQTLKFELAYEGLVGGNPLKTGTQQANVFVILDRKTGKAMVKSTKEILTNELDKIRISPGIDGIKLKNRASKKIDDRIANILMQVHQKNVHIAYKVKD